MIETIAIQGLRGIRDGALEGLAPLTVLTGVNGCGKSTVLDALLIGTSPRPEDAIAHAVRRRVTTRFGARWLVHNQDSRAIIHVQHTDGTDHGEHQCVLRWRRAPVHLPAGDPRWTAVQERYSQHIEVDFEGATPHGQRRGERLETSSGTGWVAFDAGNEALTSGQLDFEGSPPVLLVDPGAATPLDRAYSDATRLGRREQIIAVLRELVPDLTSIEILSEDDGSPALYIVQGSRGAIPVGVAGDGVQALVQLAVELAAAPRGKVLVEEPETYQHPAALRLTARVLLATMRRGVQVILTTHSLELIDMLVEEATPEDLGSAALFTLALDRGILRHGRLSGEQIASARSEVAEDLR